MIAVLIITQMLSVLVVVHLASEAHHCHHGLFACPPDCEHHREHDKMRAKDSEASFTQCRSNSAVTLIPQISNAVLAELKDTLLPDVPEFLTELLPRKSAGHPLDIFRPPGVI
ncbi:MAG: hypothetical protein KJO98_14920 [Rhodothermia bacterium]|nr:hypothetical protein [Rhodothermia bacterium]